MIEHNGWITDSRGWIAKVFFNTETKEITYGEYIQQPLTTDQIATLFNYRPADFNFPRLVASVRVVEKAHGIGETK